MFWKAKDAPAAPAAKTPFVRYVTDKVAPRVRESRAGSQIVEDASKRLERGLGVRGIERLILDFGRDSAMLSALAFAAAVRDASGTELDEIMYGDCYLASVFCMGTETRHRPEVDADVMEDWLSRLQTDADYLVYAEGDQIEDLVVQGPELYAHYHGNKDSILPRAHLYLLAKIIRCRRSGFDLPYRDLDPMLGPDPIVFASLERAWEAQVRAFVHGWRSTVLRVQEVTAENDEEFWPGW